MRTRVEIICVCCGKTRLVWPSLLKIGKARYCSPQCKQEGMRKSRSTSSCRRCQKVYQPKPGNTGIYCSQECFYAVRRSVKVQLQCHHCRQNFWRTEWQVTTQPTKYCSRECYWQTLIGTGGPLWQGGRSFEPYPPGFNNWLKATVRKRDNHCCTNCGKTETENQQKLSIHHIDYDKANISIDNLTSLCRSCHSLTNHNRDQWTKRFSQAA